MSSQPESPQADVSPSIDILKKTVPSENISIQEQIDESNNKTETIIKTTDSLSINEATVPQELSCIPPIGDVTTDSSTPEKHIKNQSDIFSLNATKNEQSTIFSVLGKPSKVISKGESSTTTTHSDIFSTNSVNLDPSVIFSVGGKPSRSIPKTDQSLETVNSGGSNNSNQARNPVTGYGVSSNDEFKKRGNRGRGGNPVLGLGYDNDKETNNNNNTPNTRVPPGGYSKGLW